MSPMKRTVDVEVMFDADELESYLWHEMDGTDQAEFLKWLGYRHHGYTPEVERQMLAVKEEFDTFADTTKESTIAFLESLLGWLKGDDSNE